MMMGSGISNALPWGSSTTWNTTTGTEKNAGINLTGSNLIATLSDAASNWRSIRGNSSHNSGHWVFEVTVTNRGNGTAEGLWGVGISSGVVDCNRAGLTLVGYSEVNGVGYSGGGSADTSQELRNAVGTAYGAKYTTGDIIGVKINIDTGTVTFYKNGVSQGIAETLPAGGTYYPIWSGDDKGTNPVATANFGATAFTYNYN